MRTRSRIVALAAVAMVATAAAFLACSNQGEGERCDTAGATPSDGRPAGSDDCQYPLECTSKNSLASNADLCCPHDRSQATTAACALAHAPTGDAGIPDTGAPPTTGDGAATDGAAPEAGPDASPDSGGASDAAGDAPSDVTQGG